MEESGHRELIIHRFSEYERTLRQQLDRVKGAKLHCYRESELKKVLQKALECAQGKIVELRKDIEEGRIEEHIMDVLSEVERVNLDYLFYCIESIINNEISSELYDFIDFYLMELADLDKVVIVVVRGESLSCFSLNYLLEKDLNLELPSDVMKVWIINCPTRCEIIPFEWPIILHEIAHILEEERYGILRKSGLIYDYYSLPSSQIIDGMRIRHTLEYLCDLIAFRLIGPMFLFRILDIYLTKAYVIYQLQSHPEWIRRAEFLLENMPTEYSELSLKIDELIKIVKNAVQTAKEKGEVVMDFPPELETIKSVLKQGLEIPYVPINNEEFQKAMRKLSNFIPYLKNVPALLNAAYVISRFNLYSPNVLKIFQRDEYRLHSEFMYLIADCVRLARIYNLASPLLSSSLNAE